MDERVASLEMRPAALPDRPAIAAILENARQWLAACGIAQWTQPFGDEWIEQKIAAGEFHLVYREAEPVAVVRLLWQDAVFWGECDQDDAAYIHTLVVHRNQAGRGIGEHILAWAAARARGRGRSLLRLDCGEANRALVAYYLDRGFLPVGEVEVAGEVMSLLERKIES